MSMHNNTSKRLKSMVCSKGTTKDARKTRQKASCQWHKTTKQGRRRCKPIRLGRVFDGEIYFSPYNLMSGTDADGKSLPEAFLAFLRGI